MRSLGVADLVMLFVLVVLAFDSRRLHALVGSTGRAQRAPGRPGIPAGGDPDRVGLSLQHIQMRTHVDWQDGGIGWDGPEILPIDESDDASVDEASAPAIDAGPPEPAPGRALPVLWQPFPALPAAGASGEWAQPEHRAPAFC